MACPHMICWIENGTKKWEMVEEKDSRTFTLSLMQNKSIDWHTIFIIPTNSIMGAIWLQPETHKCGAGSKSRVDFGDFFNDMGTKYEVPELCTEAEEINKNIDEKYSYDTKYGFISPAGKYYHCGYQGHANLADNICYYNGIETNNSGKWLEEHGWIRIYKPLGDHEYSVFISMDHVITDAQMKTLIKMKLDNADGIKEMLCKAYKDEYR